MSVGLGYWGDWFFGEGLFGARWFVSSGESESSCQRIQNGATSVRKYSVHHSKKLVNHGARA